MSTHAAEASLRQQALLRQHLAQRAAEALLTELLELAASLGAHAGLCDIDRDDPQLARLAALARKEARRHAAP